VKADEAAGTVLYMEREREPDRAQPSQPDRALDRDEKVKIDLPFGTALRALLKTPPPEPEPPATRKP
jgi:hypothetical protein